MLVRTVFLSFAMFLLAACSDLENTRSLTVGVWEIRSDDSFVCVTYDTDKTLLAQTLRRGLGDGSPKFDTKLAYFSVINGTEWLIEDGNRLLLTFQSKPSYMENRSAPGQRFNVSAPARQYIIQSISEKSMRYTLASSEARGENWYVAHKVASCDPAFEKQAHAKVNDSERNSPDGESPDGEIFNEGIKQRIEQQARKFFNESQKKSQ